MTHFDAAIQSLATPTPAGFIATASGTFVPAPVSLWTDEFPIVAEASAGAGTDWGFTPAPAPALYSDVAEMSAAVDEAIEEDELRDRAAIWAAVAKTEDTYRNGLSLTDLCKIDGREG